MILWFPTDTPVPHGYFIFLKYSDFLRILWYSPDISVFLRYYGIFRILRFTWDILDFLGYNGFPWYIGFPQIFRFFFSPNTHFFLNYDEHLEPKRNKVNQKCHHICQIYDIRMKLFLFIISSLHVWNIPKDRPDKEFQLEQANYDGDNIIHEAMTGLLVSHILRVNSN